MMRKPPKWCQGFVDRHGKPRWYYRRAGHKRAPLPGLPWSPEFMRAYEAALSGKIEVGAARSKPGSIGALIKTYYASPEFRNLSASTQATYRGILERFGAEHGDKRVVKLRREDVKALVAKKADTPAAANNLLRMLRMLMRVALEAGWRDDDPTAGVKEIRSRSEGFRTWSEEDIAQYEAKFPLGTRAHLALALLLYTGQRRSDVVRMGRQHIRNGVLKVTQQKTGAEVSIPVHASLKAAIDALPKDQLTFLMTAQGKPFTPAGFTNWFRDRVHEAGLHGLSPHGLRKAVCRRLAEAHCTPSEIMAISGHKTLKEVTRYTEAVNRARLAEKAIAAIGEINSGTKTVKPAAKV